MSYENCRKKIPVSNDILTNKNNLIYAINQATNENAGILLTPEGCLSGYTYKFDQKEVDDALSEILIVAKKNNLGLALATCFYEDDGNCYNQIRFYLPTGEYLGFHSKILRCAYWEIRQ